MYIEEDGGGRTDNVIENSGTVITYLKGEDMSNLGCSDINPDRNKKDENTNKINPINNYNFNTKFSEFRVNNIEHNKKPINVNDDKNIHEYKNEINENKENILNNNIIMKKKTQIKSLIKNINIEDNKY